MMERKEFYEWFLLFWYIRTAYVYIFPSTPAIISNFEATVPHNLPWFIHLISAKKTIQGHLTLPKVANSLIHIPLWYAKVNKQLSAGALICLSDILLKHCPNSQEQNQKKIRKRSPFVDNKNRHWLAFSPWNANTGQRVSLLLSLLHLLPTHFTIKWLGNCVCLYKKSGHVAICFSTYSPDIS